MLIYFYTYILVYLYTCILILYSAPLCAALLYSAVLYVCTYVCTDVVSTCLY